MFFYRLTSHDDYELKIRLWDHDGSYGEAKYQNFKILSAKDNYRLILGPFIEGKDPLFSTRVGDSLSSHNNSAFSTRDDKRWVGINWKTFRGSKYSLNQLTMAIRPKQHQLYGTYRIQS